MSNVPCGSVSRTPAAGGAVVGRLGPGLVGGGLAVALELLEILDDPAVEGDDAHRVAGDVPSRPAFLMYLLLGLGVGGSPPRTSVHDAVESSSWVDSRTVSGSVSLSAVVKAAGIRQLGARQPRALGTAG